MVEFAIILPVFLFMVVLAIDFGRIFFTYIQVHNAAREGANYGQAAPNDLVGITARVNSETNAQAQRGESTVTVTTKCAAADGSNLACAVAAGGAGPGNRITVNVHRTFSFLTPLINNVFGGSLAMDGSATASVLGYVPSASATQPPGCSVPAASFTLIVQSGRDVFANPSASTPNSGICNISGYNWDWGDGNETVGTATGDAHTYAADGTWTVTLEVTNQAGSATTSHAVTVPFVAPTPTPTPVPTATPTPGPTATPVPTATPTPTPTATPVVCTRPTANFTWTNPGNKQYDYHDASTVANPAKCPITDWFWTFTDAGGTHSNAQNPSTVSYGNNSSHPVTLTVTNAGGSSTITINS